MKTCFIIYYTKLYYLKRGIFFFKKFDRSYKRIIARLSLGKPKIPELIAEIEYFYNYCLKLEKENYELIWKV